MKDARIGHFAARLGERLALLGCHQQREVVLVLDLELIPLPQDRGALLGRTPAP